DAGTVGRKINAMRQFDAAYDLDHFVCPGVDHVNRIASAIRDINPRPRRRRVVEGSPRTSATNPVRHCQPVRIALRGKLSTTGMKGIASSFWRKRMKEERAGVRISGNHLAQGILEVRARLFFRPRGFSRGQHLKTENSVR